MNEQQLFQHLSTAADLAAPVVPGTAGTVAKYLGRAFALGADFIAAGKDPIKHIQRIRERATMIKEVDRGWEDELRAKFGPAPEAADTLENVYEDED